MDVYFFFYVSLYQLIYLMAQVIDNHLIFVINHVGHTDVNIVLCNFKMKFNNNSL